MKLELITTDPDNVRSATECKDLIASMKALIEAGCEPLIQPLVINGDGRLIAGHRRYAALKAIGWKGDVPCHVIEKGNATAYQLHENSVRQGLEAGDEVRVYTKLAKQGLKIGAIAKLTMQKTHRVQQLLKLGGLPDLAIEMLNNGVINLDGAAILTRFPENAILDFLESHQKQNSIPGWQIREALGDEEINVKHALFDLKKAGIKVVTDLFGSNDYLDPSDVEKYCELQRAAVKDFIEKAKKESGEVQMLPPDKSVYQMQPKYLGDSVEVDLTPKAKNEIAALEKKQSKIEYGDQQWDDLEEKIDAIRENPANHAKIDGKKLIRVLSVSDDGLRLNDHGYFKKPKVKADKKPNQGDPASMADEALTQRVLIQRRHAEIYPALRGALYYSGAAPQVLETEPNAWHEGLGFLAAAMYWRQVGFVGSYFEPQEGMLKDMPGFVCQHYFPDMAGHLLTTVERQELMALTDFRDVCQYFTKHPAVAVRLLMQKVAEARPEAIFDLFYCEGQKIDYVMGSVSKILAPAYYAGLSKEKLELLVAEKKLKGKAKGMGKKDMVALLLQHLGDKEILPHLDTTRSEPAILNRSGVSLGRPSVGEDCEDDISDSEIDSEEDEYDEAAE